MTQKEDDRKRSEQVRPRQGHVFMIPVRGFVLIAVLVLFPSFVTGQKPDAKQVAQEERRRVRGAQALRRSWPPTRNDRR